MELLFTTRTDW